MLEMINSLPDKLYNGAIVKLPRNNEQEPLPDTGHRGRYQGTAQIAAGGKEISQARGRNWITMAHSCQAFHCRRNELLQLMQELQRQEYPEAAPAEVIPGIGGNGSPQGKSVKLNGHFKILKDSDDQNHLFDFGNTRLKAAIFENDQFKMDLVLDRTTDPATIETLQTHQPQKRYFPRCHQS